MIGKDLPHKLLEHMVIVKRTQILENTHKKIPMILNCMYKAFASLCFDRISNYNAKKRVEEIMSLLYAGLRCPSLTVSTLGLYLCKYSLEKGKEAFEENRFSNPWSRSFRGLQIYFDVLEVCRKEKLAFIPIVQEYEIAINECVRNFRNTNANFLR